MYLWLSKSGIFWLSNTAIFWLSDLAIFCKVYALFSYKNWLCVFGFQNPAYFGYQTPLYFSYQIWRLFAKCTHFEAIKIGYVFLAFKIRHILAIKLRYIFAIRFGYILQSVRTLKL